jgi:hypothetical protein
MQAQCVAVVERAEQQHKRAQGKAAQNGLPQHRAYPAALASRRNRWSNGSV